MTAPQLVPGSVAARALYELWQGTPIVVIDSLPGAGKNRSDKDGSQLALRLQRALAVAASMPLNPMLPIMADLMSTQGAGHQGAVRAAAAER